MKIKCCWSDGLPFSSWILAFTTVKSALLPLRSVVGQIARLAGNSSPVVPQLHQCLAWQQFLSCCLEAASVLSLATVRVQLETVGVSATLPCQ